MAGSDAAAVADAFRTERPLPDIPGLVFRHLRAPDDYAPMNVIANATRVSTGDPFTTTSEQMQQYYEHPSDFDPARDVAVVELEGRIVGYVRGGVHQEVAGPRVYEVLPFLDPATPPDRVLPLMISAMEDHLRDLAVVGSAGRQGVRNVRRRLGAGAGSDRR